MSDLENIKNWFNSNYKLGRKLGYPKCCVKSFCQQPPEILNKRKPTSEDFERFKASKIKGVYTGFIPCYEHAKLINIGKIKLSDLIQNRNKDYPPFPEAFE